MLVRPELSHKTCGTMSPNQTPEGEEEVAQIVLNKWPDPLLEVMLYPERFMES
ncbi:hypothetical protein BJ985_000006 [Corynebacterium tuberculostearicum]|nr:hypothetical protein [Corynebacterium tuberculostearicum]